MVQVGDANIPILRVEDVVKDRLAAFIHWRDNQSLIQAVAVMLNHRLSAQRFNTFCLREGAAAQTELLLRFYQRAKRKRLVTMQQLETELATMLLE